MVYSYFMNVYLALFLNFLPLIVCGVSFYIFAKMNVKEELLSCLFGLLAVFPIVIIKFTICQMSPDLISLNELGSKTVSFSSLLSENLVYSGLIEELLKAVFIAMIPHKKIEFRNFFMASILCGLSLGSFESITYVMRYLARVTENSQTIYSLVFVRMISSDLLHAFCAGLSGIFVYSIKVKKTDLIPIIYAVFIHGIYDFFACFDSGIRWFSFAALFFAIFECRVHYEKVLDAELKEILEADKKALESSRKGRTRKTSVTRGTKKHETNADVTVVTSASKIVRKRTSQEPKPVEKTKTRARKVKSPEPQVLADPDVTPEFNEE